MAPVAAVQRSVAGPIFEDGQCFGAIFVAQVIDCIGVFGDAGRCRTLEHTQKHGDFPIKEAERDFPC